MKKKQKKIDPFKTKTKNPVRFVDFKKPQIASELRDIAMQLSYYTRSVSLSDRLRIRKVISSLQKNANTLDGK